MNLYDMTIYEQIFNNDIEKITNWFYFKNVIFPIVVIILLFLILVVLIYYFQKKLLYIQANSAIKTDNNLFQESNKSNHVKSFNWIALIIVIGGLLCLFSIWLT